MDESESLDDAPDEALYLSFFLLDLIELVSCDKLDFFDNEYDNDGSGSRSPGTCAFPFCSGKCVGSVGDSVGSVSGISSGNFVLPGIKSIGDIVPLFVFVQIGVKSKGGQLIEAFWCPKS